MLRSDLRSRGGWQSSKRVQLRFRSTRPVVVTLVIADEGSGFFCASSAVSLHRKAAPASRLTAAMRFERYRHLHRVQVRA